MNSRKQSTLRKRFLSCIILLAMVVMNFSFGEMSRGVLADTPAGDLTPTAAATKTTTTTDSSMSKFSKSVTAVNTNTVFREYQIDLSFTVGSKLVEGDGSLDLILVLDTANTMISGKIQDFQKTLQDFCNALAALKPDTRVAFIPFAASAPSSGNSTLSFTTIGVSAPGGATSVNPIITNYISGLSQAGGKSVIQSGTQAAINLLKGSNAENAAVILLTDGKTTGSVPSAGWPQAGGDNYKNYVLDCQYMTGMGSVVYAVQGAKKEDDTDSRYMVEATWDGGMTVTKDASGNWTSPANAGPGLIVTTGSLAQVKSSRPNNYFYGDSWNVISDHLISILKTLVTKIDNVTLTDTLSDTVRQYFELVKDPPLTGTPVITVYKGSTVFPTGGTTGIAAPTYNPTTGLIQWKPAILEQGVYTLRFTVRPTYSATAIPAANYLYPDGLDSAKGALLTNKGSATLDYSVNDKVAPQVKVDSPSTYLPPVLKVSLTANPSEVMVGSTTNLTATVTNGHGPYDYTWYRTDSAGNVLDTLGAVNGAVGPTFQLNNVVVPNEGPNYYKIVVTDKFQNVVNSATTTVTGVTGSISVTKASVVDRFGQTISPPDTTSFSVYLFAARVGGALVDPATLTPDKALVVKDANGNTLPNPVTIALNQAAGVFSHLPAGDYYVKEILSAGSDYEAQAAKLVTIPADITAKDKAVSFSNKKLRGFTGSVTVTKNAYEEFYELGAYGGRKIGDLFNIILTHQSGVSDPAKQADTSLASGSAMIVVPHGSSEAPVHVDYGTDSVTFDNLPNGTYTISESAVNPGRTYLSVTSGSGLLTFTIANGETAPDVVINNIDALNKPTGAIHVTKSSDSTLVDDGDKFLFTLEEFTGSGWRALPQSLSLGKGETDSFSPLYPGTYRVTEAVPSKWPTAYTVTNDRTSTGKTAEISVVTSAEQVTFTNTVRTYGQVWGTKLLMIGSTDFPSDLDHTFTFQLLSEDGDGNLIPAVDKDGLPVADATITILAGQSSAAQQLLFSNLLPGAYWVREVTDYSSAFEAPADQMVVVDFADDSDPTTKPSAVATFTNLLKEASITVLKLGPNESTLSGATFELQDIDGNVLATQTTDETGAATFSNLALGVPYYLKEIKAPKGYKLLPDLEGPIVLTSESIWTLQAGQSITNEPFEEGDGVISVDKTIKDNDGTFKSSAEVTPESTMVIRIVVTNSGITDLYDLTLTDVIDGGEPVTLLGADGSFAPGVTDISDEPFTGILPQGESVTFLWETNTPAADVTQTDTVTATAKYDIPDEALTATASDTADATGMGSTEPSDDKAELTVVKRINGHLSTSANPVDVSATSGNMTITFEVTNTGDFRVNDIVLNDNVLKEITDEDFPGFLDPGDSYTFTATWPIPARNARHANVVNVAGTYDENEETKTVEADPAYAYAVNRYTPPRPTPGPGGGPGGGGNPPVYTPEPTIVPEIVPLAPPPFIVTDEPTPLSIPTPEATVIELPEIPKANPKTGVSSGIQVMANILLILGLLGTFGLSVTPRKKRSKAK